MLDLHAMMVVWYFITDEVVCFITDSLGDGNDATKKVTSNNPFWSTVVKTSALKHETAEFLPSKSKTAISPEVVMLPWWTPETRSNVSDLLNWENWVYRQLNSFVILAQKRNEHGSVAFHTCTTDQKENDILFSSVQDGIHKEERKWCSVQFKIVPMHLKKPICIPPRLSEVFPTLPLKQFQCSSDWWWPYLISTFQGRSSSTSSFLQVIDGVMSLALCPQVVSEASRHFRSSEKNKENDISWNIVFHHNQGCTWRGWGVGGWGWSSRGSAPLPFFLSLLSLSCFKVTNDVRKAKGGFCHSLCHCVCVHVIACVILTQEMILV